MKKQVLAIIVLFVITALGQCFANKGDVSSTNVGNSNTNHKGVLNHGNLSIQP